MYTQWIDSAGRARNILDAWQRRDFDGLKAELTLPSGLMADDNFEEQERMDLLRGIAQQMRQDLPDLSLASNRGNQPEVCFRLLEHLAQSGNHPALRSRKLAFFPHC